MKIYFYFEDNETLFTEDGAIDFAYSENVDKATTYSSWDYSEIVWDFDANEWLEKYAVEIMAVDFLDAVSQVTTLGKPVVCVIDKW